MEISKQLICPLKGTGSARLNEEFNKGRSERKSWSNLGRKHPPSPLACNKILALFTLFFLLLPRLAWPLVESTWRDQLIALHRASPKKAGEIQRFQRRRWKVSGEDGRIGEKREGALATLVVRQPLRHLATMSLSSLNTPFRRPRGRLNRDPPPG